MYYIISGPCETPKKVIQKICIITKNQRGSLFGTARITGIERKLEKLLKVDTLSRKKHSN